jgi:uncharacterized protein (DUF2141 family)
MITKKLLLLPIVLTCFIAMSYSQIKLTVEVYELRNNQGVVSIELINDKGEALKGLTQTITDGKCAFVFELPGPGKYGFRYFHDENKNKKIDLNFLGIPKEGYGYSAFESGAFLPPNYKKTLLNITNSVVIRTKPGYILN